MITKTFHWQTFNQKPRVSMIIKLDILAYIMQLLLFGCLFFQNTQV